MEEKNNKRYFDKAQVNSDLTMINEKASLMAGMDQHMKLEEGKQEDQVYSLNRQQIELNYSRKEEEAV